VRFAFGATGSAAWLAGFSLTLAVAAPVLMAGQTPSSEWLTPWCDELAPPMLAVLAAGIASSLAGVGLAGRIPAPLARFAVMAAVAGIGLWLAAPLAGPCLAGPYGAMSDEARSIITDRIAEAQPAWRSFAALPFGVNALITPVVAVVLLSAALGWRARHSLTAPQRQALLLALAPAAIGLALAMVQIRALSVAAPSMPLLAGFIAMQVVHLLTTGRQRAGAALGTAALVLVFLPELPLLAALTALPPANAGASADSDAADAWKPLSGACRGQDTLDDLAALSPLVPSDAILLAELNFGAMILAHSPFSTTSAGYHRSGDAFLNGVAPFQSEAAMIAALHKSGASHVVICRGGGGAGPWGAALLAGETPAWLTPVAQPLQTILVLQANRATLPAAPVAASE
jgi:hypothetical protein